MKTVIKVENLGKQYRLGQVGTGTLSHDVNRWWHRVRGKEDPYLKIGEVNDRSKKGDGNLVWALKNINFEVKQGEVLGIIGKNGAGKSTLLKILSRVTGPTVGDIKVKGRIASLLEVGTGFHPELSGRENIFLNGAILGMTKSEIRSKFDEIVDFSGVERYIDTPVKHYSSGMYVRLAFAVAAHLEPEILIVDEVLAVGDAEFQKKCLGKMKDVSGQGRTVLFVSHNMAAVKNLCNRGILLDKGGIVCDGNIEEVMSKYSTNAEFVNSDLSGISKRLGVGEIKFSKINVRSENKLNELKSGETLFIDLYYSAKVIEPNAKYEFVFGVWNNLDSPMFMITNTYLDKEILLEKEVGKVTFKIKNFPLNTGTYNVNLLLKKNNIDMDFIENAYQFKIEDGNFYNTPVFYPSNYEGFYVDFDLEK